MNLRLGRRPADPVRLDAAPKMRAFMGAEPPPERIDRNGIEFNPILGQNDAQPDCTAVGLFNAATAAALVIGGYALTMDEMKALPFYAASIGKPNATPGELAATDGAVILDVLGFQIKNGIDIGQQVPFAAHYGTISTHRTGIARAMGTLATSLMGVNMYDSDMQSVYNPTSWDQIDGKPKGPLVGGHCLIPWSYTGLGDEDEVKLATWGILKTATWRWVEDRLEEAHGLLWRQLVPPDVDADGLRRAVEGWVA